MPSFLYLLLLLLVAGGVHIALLRPRSVKRAGEVSLLYLLIGYCGVPQVALAIWSLTNPDRVATILGFPTGNPFQTFLAVAFLGMGLIAVLTAFYGGSFRAAAAIVWAVFFAGANFIHTGQGSHSHAAAFHIFLTHLLIALLLAGALLASGLLKRTA